MQSLIMQANNTNLALPRNGLENELMVTVVIALGYLDSALEVRPKTS